jgi:phage terminase large subunit
MIAEMEINEAYQPFLDASQRTQIFYGGSSSGKSVFISQRTVLDVLQGRNYLVLRQVGKTCRESVYNEICKTIDRSGMGDLFRRSVSPMTITCIRNGRQIIFGGLDDVQKLKSVTPQVGVITDIWIEEATETNRDDVKELRKRLRGSSDFTKRITLTFNPIYKTHWIYTDYFAGRFQDSDSRYFDDGMLIVKTTHRDNGFLELDDRAELENEPDRYYHDVYTLGNWGVLGHAIFTNWRTEDLSELRNSFDNYRNGLDFGFTNDPTCLVRMAKRHKTIYITDGLYEYGLTNDVIAERVRPIVGAEYLWCDAAEPKSIAELQNYQINARSAIKGPGSVSFGLDWLRRHEIVIHSELQGIINDFSLYHWRENRDGEVLNEPVDKNNHAPDAARYGWSSVLQENRNTAKARYGSKNRLGIY